MQCLPSLDHDTERMTDVGDFTDFQGMENTDITQNIYYNQ